MNSKGSHATITKMRHHNPSNSCIHSLHPITNLQFDCVWAAPDVESATLRLNKQYQQHSVSSSSNPPIPHRNKHPPNMMKKLGFSHEVGTYFWLHQQNSSISHFLLYNTKGQIQRGKIIIPSSNCQLPTTIIATNYDYRYSLPDVNYHCHYRYQQPLLLPTTNWQPR